ncbi:hypothetical protein Patl1_18577 [Pistacia atlantica]|uniref:Uncharacterized protein n=1 Tax=Pistacia atlantica TaxID=434234 RepID=A0ACC1BXG4_9ROSI|nr:hypothetical protein Patl1_18577 [Pistacia atlantica]
MFYEKNSAGDRFLRDSSWAKTGDYALGSKLGGKRVGMGKIGSEVVKRLQAFGSIISFNSRTKKSSIPFPYYADVYELAVNTAVLVVCCALTEETHHIINEDVMTVLGKEGVIINVGCGALIDEKEMVKHLVRGEIGDAGLDVF